MNPLKMILLLALTGCGTPSVPVKEKWTQSIQNYSFVPLYPMREDVYVGDIRIHRLDGKAGSGLHSRFIASMAVEGARKPISDRPARAQNFHPPKGSPKQLRKMSLPALEAARVTAADLSGSGVLGLWNLAIGGNVKDSETVMVTLDGIESVEIADWTAASRFLQTVEEMLAQPDQLLGICVAAKAMGDPKLEQTAISLVTRVAYARGLDYSYGESFSLALKASAQQAANQTTAGAGIQEDTSGSLAHKATFDRPMAFGVDAIMIQPILLKETLAEDCKTVTEGFVASPASEAQTGAPQLAN